MMEEKGISLIALIITILVIIVLAGAVVLTVIKNNPLDSASEAVFKSDIKTFKTELSLTVATKLSEGISYTQINADKNSTPNIIEYIGSMEGKKNYLDILEVVEGELKYIGNNDKEKEWAEDSGINIDTPTFGTNGNTEVGVAKVNKPELKGMTPVRWGGAIEDINITKNSSDWYAYIAGDNSTDSKNSKWANSKTKDGSYFVWIPRYAYKITEKPTTEGNVKGKIEVVFLKETTNEYDSDGSGNMRDAVADGYIVHPAFTFGTKELTGIWVGKYEISSVEGNAAYGEFFDSDDVTTKTIQIKPNVSSWRNIRVATIFENCYTMASKPIYGFKGLSDGDTHMIKNSEWAAVLYLAHSQYGRNRNPIANNESDTYITGIAGVNSSTTGNEYGIYDMSGGASEYVAGNLTGYIGTAVGSQPNFNRIYSDSTLKNKFFDFYDYSGISGSGEKEANYQANRTKKGDALYETSAGTGVASWFRCYSLYVESGSPWFIRGGHNLSCEYTNSFTFLCSTGFPHVTISSRVALAI